MKCIFLAPFVLAPCMNCVDLEGGFRNLRSKHHHFGHPDSIEDNGNLRWAHEASETLKSNGVHNTAGPEANMCRDGKLLPSFYLLGGPKCATTTASIEFGRFGGVRAAPKLWSEKEWHFWEQFTPDADPEEVRTMFRNELDACPDDRLVLGDFSVTNLASVPAPDGMELSPCSCQEDSRHSGNTGGGDVPRLLSRAYGKDVGNITLMMLLRNPIGRIQSSWYHAKAEDFADYWGFRDCCTTSFNKALTTIIEASDQMQFKRKLGGEGSVWTSLFGRHIEEYLKYFHAKQMLIVPYKQYLNREARVPICADLRKRLNIGLNCTNHDDIHENIHPHPPLEEDVDSKTLEKLNEMFRRENSRLLEVLVKAGQQGANLAGFTGSVNNIKDVEMWLTENW